MCGATEATCSWLDRSGRRRRWAGLPLLALVHAVRASDQADDLGVMEEAVKHGPDGGGVAEDLAPVLEDWSDPCLDLDETDEEA